MYNIIWQIIRFSNSVEYLKMHVNITTEFKYQDSLYSLKLDCTIKQIYIDSPM